MLFDHRGAILLTAFALFTLIGLAPTTQLILDSVTTNGRIDYSAYTNILSSPRQWRLLKNTITLAAVTTTSTILIGAPLAFLLYKTDIPHQNLYKIAFTTVLIIPPYMEAIAWINLLGRTGYLTQIITSLLGLKEPLFTIYGFWGSAFVLTTSSLPFVVLTTGGALNSIDRGMEEAAILACGFRKTLLKILLPLASQGMLFGALLVFITAISDFGVVSFLTYDTYTTEVYSSLAAFYNAKTATAYSLTLIAATLAVMLLYTRLYGTKIYTSILSASKSKPFQLGVWSKPTSILVLSILTLSLILPLTSLLYASLHSYGKFTSLDNYRIALTQGAPNITNSLLYAAAGSTLAIITGSAIAYGAQKNKKISKTLLETTLILPYILPGTILGLGLIVLWNHPKPLIYSTPLIIIIGYAAKYTVIAYKSSETALNKISQSLEEAATMTGAPWHKTLRKITIPLTTPTLITGWTLTYILCMTELNTTIMIYPPGQATIPVSLFILQHAGPPGLVAALSILLILTTILPLIIITKTQKHKQGEQTT